MPSVWELRRRMPRLVPGNYIGVNIFSIDVDAFRVLPSAAEDSMSTLRHFAVSLASLLVATTAVAQERFPSKPIHPFGPACFLTPVGPV
jgi:hypothetical protein